MASNYIIFNNANEGLTDSTYPDWDSSWVALTNQPDSLSVSNLTSYYAANSFGSMTAFQFPLAPATGTSDWIMVRYDYVDASTTGTAHVTGVINALKTHINDTQAAAHLEAEYSNIISGSMSTFFTTTLGLSNVSNGTFGKASYNWSTVDTSGYNYSDGFASSFSGNEDYSTDYWSLTDFQTPTVGAKSQVISKISTNSDDILEFIVKKALTQNQIRQLYVQLLKDGIIT